MVGIGTFGLPNKCKLFDYSNGRNTCHPFWQCSHGCPSCYIWYGLRWNIYGKKADSPVSIDIPQAIKDYKKLKPFSEIECSPSCDAFDLKLEKRYKITQQLLTEFKKIEREDVFITFLTKSHLIQDYILLMNPETMVIQMTVESNRLDITSPHASTYSERIEAIRLLTDNGLKVGLRIDPIIPKLVSKEDISAILSDCIDAGIEHTTISFIKLFPNQLIDISKKLNIDFKTFMEKEGKEYFVAEDDSKKEFAQYIADYCNDAGITFSMCRESTVKDTGCCDPFHLLKKWKRPNVNTLDNYMNH